MLVVLHAEKMNFTQKEIIEIKKHICSLKVPIEFIRIKENEIKLEYPNKLGVFVVLKKDEIFKLTAINSDDSIISENFNSLEKLIYQIRNWIKKIKIDNPFDLLITDDIHKISPKFYISFQEAVIIHYLGFENSSGMIFRKSLEILIKDFLNYLIPEFKGIIASKTIGQILKHFYNMENQNINPKKQFNSIIDKLETIKPLAIVISNTFQIGNDFSHYERKLEKYTASNMKENIEKIIDFINVQFIKEMAILKENELNKDFNNQKFINKN